MARGEMIPPKNRGQGSTARPIPNIPPKTGPDGMTGKPRGKGGNTDGQTGKAFGKTVNKLDGMSPKSEPNAKKSNPGDDNGRKGGPGAGKPTLKNQPVRGRY